MAGEGAPKPNKNPEDGELPDQISLWDSLAEDSAASEPATDDHSEAPAGTDAAGDTENAPESGADDAEPAPAEASADADEGTDVEAGTDDDQVAIELDGDAEPSSAADVAAEKPKRSEEEIRAELEALDAEIAGFNPSKLVAINADFTHDRRELAQDTAEQLVNAEVAKAGLIGKIWKGTLFKKYFTRKYQQELLSGTRRAANGKTVDTIIKERSQKAMERFMLGATEDMSYIHQNIGEDGDGEKLVGDGDATAYVRRAIEEFARSPIPEGGSIDDLKREFSNKMSRMKQTKIKRGDMGKGDLVIDNYLDVAIQAREYVEHGMAIDRVMRGFKVYNAEVRDGIRTEAHRDAVDKAIDWVESHTGSLVIPQILAGAAGIAMGLTQTGVRAAYGVGAGIAASGLIAGLKERNRVTEDRARMMRDIVNGMEYNGTSGGSSSKSDKYEQRIGGTLYDLKSADSLIQGIATAREMEGAGRSDALLRSLAEASVRIELTDSEAKDLISYSSIEDRGAERLALDMAVIRARKGLNPEDRAKLEAMKTAVRNTMAEKISKKDKDFNKLRAAAACKKAGKSVLMGAATFLISQEVMAALDPNKIGLLEKFGILKTQNAADAKETLLASGFGLARGQIQGAPAEAADTVTGVRGDQEADIAALKQAGYEQVPAGEATITSKQAVDVSPADSMNQVRVKYSGWAEGRNADRLHLTDGKFVSTMQGNSVLNGRNLNYDELAKAGRIKGFLTVGGAKFEVQGTMDAAGHLTWGDNGIFTTTTGETIKAIGPNGERLYKYFEVAMVDGTENGVTSIVPFATEVGKNTFDGTIQGVAEVPTTVQLFDFVKAATPGEMIERGISMEGIAVPFGVAPRTSLGAARRRRNRTYTPPASSRATGGGIPVAATSYGGANPAAERPAEAEAEPVTPPAPAELAAPAAPAEELPAPAAAPELPAPDTVEAPAEPSNPGEALAPVAAAEPAPVNSPETPAPVQSEAISTERATASSQERAEIPGADTNRFEANELASEEQALLNMIEDSRNIIGDAAWAYMTEVRLPGEPVRNFDIFWDTFDEAAKDRIDEIINAINRSGVRDSIKWGKDFREWYMKRRIAEFVSRNQTPAPENAMPAAATGRVEAPAENEAISAPEAYPALPSAPGEEPPAPQTVVSMVDPRVQGGTSIAANR